MPSPPEQASASRLCATTKREASFDQPCGGQPAYREYATESVRLVLFIKRAKALGFSLAEVEDLVGLRERAWAGDAPRQLRFAAVTKVEEIDQRIRQLGALRSALAELVDACDTACPVRHEPTGECDSPRRRRRSRARGSRHSTLTATPTRSSSRT